MATADGLDALFHWFGNKSFKIRDLTEAQVGALHFLLCVWLTLVLMLTVTTLELDFFVSQLGQNLKFT